MNKSIQGGEDNKRLVLLVTTVGSFMTPFDSNAATLAIPSIGSDLGGGLVLLSWISVGYLLSLTTFLLVFGRLGDMKGRKLLFVIGVVVFTFSSVVSGLSGSIYQLIVARLIQGMGASMMSGNAVAFLTSVFPSSERGKVVGIVTGATYAGLSAGPVLGGLLISHFGWRSIFYVNIPIGLVTASICYFKTHETLRVNEEASFDVLGGLTLTISLSSLLASVTLGQTGILSRVYVFALMLLAILSFLLFIFIEKKSSSQPIIDLRLFTENKMFAFSNATAFLNYLASYGIGFLLSLYLQTVLMLEPHQAGLVMLSQPLLMTIVSPISGHISDRMQPRRLASIGLAVMSGAMLVLSAATIDTSLQSIVMILAVLGAGYGLFSSPNTSAVMGSVSKEALGVGSGTLSTMRFLGQSLSLVLVTFILAGNLSSGVPLVGRGPLNVSVQEFLYGFRITLQTCAIIAAGAVVISLGRGHNHSKA
ncbi:MFS transporter [Candidatus Bathyarchaeota archaeon]|nr:MFS transporter [Candidatus Bathyarchaeota archaeon]